MIGERKQCKYRVKLAIQIRFGKGTIAMLTRVLFSGKNQCPANCAYCFAKWENYTPQPTIDFWHDNEMAEVVYPCCDSDIEQNGTVLSNLWEKAKTLQKLYISISTKRSINDTTLKLYKKLDQFLQDNKKGFIKIGVSLTTKYRIAEIEPGTAGYDERRLFFGKLQNYGFHTAIIFKPILPFIDLNEYKEMIHDYSGCNYFLLGNLYVDEETEFYRVFIKNKCVLESCAVSWLPRHPIWKYVEQPARLKHIEEYINSCNGYVFFSDIDLIEGMIKRS